jgi:hypothetical protein
MHGKFPAVRQNQRHSILLHETIPLTSLILYAFVVYKINSDIYTVRIYSGIQICNCSADLCGSVLQHVRGVG